MRLKKFNGSSDIYVGGQGPLRLGAPLGATGRVGRGAVLTRRSVSARDTVGACSQYVSSAGSESHAMCDHESGPSAQPTRLRYVGPVLGHHARSQRFYHGYRCGLSVSITPPSAGTFAVQ